MKSILPCIIVFVSLLSAKAQNRASCILGDTLHLQIQSFRGSVQWQQSDDNLVWEDISGETSAVFSIIPQTEGLFVRAAIQEEDCAMFYESAFLVDAVDTASESFQGFNFMIEQLDAQIISEEQNLIVLDISTNEFSLSPGNFLSGLNQQPFTHFIDAVIVNGSTAQVFLNLEGVSVYQVPMFFGETVFRKVMGRVLDENGNPMFFAEVRIGDSLRLSDLNGVFVFESAPVYERMGYLTVNKTGYFEGSRTFVPLSGGTITEIRLLSKNPTIIFSSSEGGTVTAESVHLIFPPNVVSLNGNIYSGNVRVYVNYINPEDENFISQMPGDLWGNQEGYLMGLTSFGMIAIEMTDDLGNELEIMEGQTVRAQFPVSAGLLVNAPETIDLWSFNEQFGYWLDEGEAILSGNVYEAELPHFSFWNCDIPWDVIYLNGIITDETGNPLQGVTISLESEVIGIRSTVTGPDGSFGGLVPENATLNAFLTIRCGLGIGEPFLEFTLNTLDEDTTLTISGITMPQLNFLQGSVELCGGEPLIGGYVISASEIAFLSEGNFFMPACAGIDSVRIVKTNPMQFGPWNVFPINGGINDIGVLELCSSTSVLTDTLADGEGNVYNTVLIGDQWWMAENLRTKHYSDGSEITISSDGNEWYNSVSGLCNSHFGSPQYLDLYGNFYNWYASVDPRNVCPVNWHVPSDEDWQVMEAFLGMDEISLTQIGFRGFSSNIGGKMKSISGWLPGNIGANNISGLSTIGSGNLNVWPNNVSSANIGYSCVMWSTTDTDSTNAYMRLTDQSTNGVNRYAWTKNSGHSIRCVRD
ncbi:MAG: FISUMP domain-containing protein [Bacteroidia bacterium]